MKKILIADDDDNIRLYLSKNLEDAGYHILHAADGQETMRVVRSEKPQLVLLDLYMPKMHGYEVCREIRADPDPEIAAMKIVIVSVKNYPVDIKTAKEVGADHYIVKPHSVKELMKVIEKHVGSRLELMPKILIVDDDDRIRLFIRETLKRSGFEILEAANGEEAVKLARAEKPQLMFLDLAMPKMHGYEVCKAIRADPDPAVKSIKIVITTAKSYPVDIRTAKEVGSDLYLVKPFGLKELRDAVAALLGAPPA